MATKPQVPLGGRSLAHARVLREDKAPSVTLRKVRRTSTRSLIARSLWILAAAIVVVLLIVLMLLVVRHALRQQSEPKGTSDRTTSAAQVSSELDSSGVGGGTGDTATTTSNGNTTATAASASGTSHVGGSGGTGGTVDGVPVLDGAAAAQVSALPTMSDSAGATTGQSIVEGADGRGDSARRDGATVARAVSDYNRVRIRRRDASVYIRMFTHLQQEVRLLSLVTGDKAPTKLRALAKAIVNADSPDEAAAQGSMIHEAGRCAVELTVAYARMTLGLATNCPTLDSIEVTLATSDMEFPGSLRLHSETTAQVWSFLSESHLGISGSHADTCRRLALLNDLPGVHHAAQATTLSAQALAGSLRAGASTQAILDEAKARSTRASSDMERVECGLESRARLAALLR